MKSPRTDIYIRIDYEAFGYLPSAISHRDEFESYGADQLVTDRYRFLFIYEDLRNLWTNKTWPVLETGPNDKILHIDGRLGTSVHEHTFELHSYNDTAPRLSATFFSPEKLVQNKILERFYEIYPGVRRLRTLTQLPEDSQKLQGKYVMKPCYGARGLCQTIIDFDKLGIRRLKDVLDNSQRPEEFMIALGSNLTLGTTHREKHGERERSLQYRNKRFLYTEYLPNIDKEFRIIVNGYGYPHMVMERHRIETDIPGYFQGTGIKGVVHALRNKEQFLDLLGSQSSDLYDLICALNIPLASVDVFSVKNDQGVSELGIFEFSQNYGVVGIPMEVLDGYLTDFLSRIADQLCQS